MQCAVFRKSFPMLLTLNFVCAIIGRNWEIQSGKNTWIGVLTMNKTEVVVCGVPFESPNVKEILQKMKEDGVTSVQLYMNWNRYEPNQRGVFDFSYYDWQVELIKEAGLKFVPFILIGPRYASPDWWLADEKHVGLVCLEHGKTSPIESIWNMDFRTEVERVLKAFSEHYLPMDVLESVQPGICGDYGEAIMPVKGNWPGAYHTHQGMWCGGADAVASFRLAMHQKYGTIEQLNQAWRSFYKDFSDLTTFLQSKMPSRTAWFDLVDWYRGSMTEYVDFWMGATRKYFPDTPIYMCTGGIETPDHAALFSDQAKICARYDGGIRLTNERNNFFSNFFDGVAYTHSACEQYGAYYGLEPVGSMTKEGVGSRIFGSAVFGNRQIFFYFENIYPKIKMDAENAKIFAEYINLVQEKKTDKKTAVLWPAYVGIMEGGIPERLRNTATFIRQRTDYRFVNENMIADDILDEVKTLIIPCDVFTRRDTADKICEWVEKGGILFTAGRVTDLELEPITTFDEMLGFTAESDLCEGHTGYQIPPDVPFKRFAAKERYHHEAGYNGLAEDVHILSVSEPKMTERFNIMSGRVFNAFYRNHGKGIAISYFGPISFHDDAQNIFGPCAFPALLDDILEKYAKDLRVAEGEVVRGEIGDKVYALYPNGEIKEV